MRSLLQAACLRGDSDRLRKLIDAKLALKSMNVGQRVYWLVTGLFVSAESYRDALASYTLGRERRLQRLAEMVMDPCEVPGELSDGWGVPVLEALVRLLGPFAEERLPDGGRAYRVTEKIGATLRIPRFLDRIAASSLESATGALEALSSDPRLASWRSRILDALDRQRAIRREASFRHPTVEAVTAVLDQGKPANPADLAALANDLLLDVARDIRDGPTSGWRDFWNVDGYGRATSPRPENACRDTIIGMLHGRFEALQVDAEVRYAEDKRADIRIAADGMGIPVEAKRSCHRELWSAMRTQLIAKYTRDPGCDGYGIYLVFWFGEAERCRPTPGAGKKPRTAEELREALLDTLSESERRKISVRVVDVSKPGG